MAARQGELAVFQVEVVSLSHSEPELDVAQRQRGVYGSHLDLLGWRGRKRRESGQLNVAIESEYRPNWTYECEALRHNVKIAQDALGRPRHRTPDRKCSGRFGQNIPERGSEGSGLQSRLFEMQRLERQNCRAFILSQVVTALDGEVHARPGTLA